MARSSIEDPLKNSNFLVEVDGFVRAGFSDVTGLGVKIEVVSYREGGDNQQARKTPGTTTYSDITLKRGVLATQNDGARDLFDFVRDVHDVQSRQAQARDFRRNLDIVVPGRDGSTGMRIRVYNAWPSEWKLGDLSASGNETLMEEMTLCHEGFDVVA